jgi:hypothetical protein
LVVPSTPAVISSHEVGRLPVDSAQLLDKADLAVVTPHPLPDVELEIRISHNAAFLQGRICSASGKFRTLDRISPELVRGNRKACRTPSSHYATHWPAAEIFRKESET